MIIDDIIENFFDDNKSELVRNYPGLKKNYLKRELVDYIDFDLGVKRQCLNSEQYIKIRGFFEELKLGRPIEHITGQAHFFGRDFIVSSKVLAPRFETELLVEKANSIIKLNNKSECTVAEVGVGSGCIGVSILCENSGRPIKFIGTDISSDALEVAEKNFNKFTFSFNKESNFSLREMDRLEKIKDQTFDLIVTNPPYIKQSMHRDLVHSQVVDYEPHVALFLEDSLYEKWFLDLCETAYRLLSPEGVFLMEGHENELVKLKDLVSEKLKIHCSLFKDLNNRWRILSFKK